MIPREDWDSADTDPWQSPAPKSELYVHHVAGRNPVGLADEMKHMRELQQRAITVKHYRDMDYNVALAPSGRLFEGRGLFALSAATLDRNDVSRSIVLMGNLDTAEPPAAQVEALPAAIVFMIHAGALTRDVAILGHYQNPEHLLATACPGRFMKPHLAWVRAEVARLLAPTPQPTPPTEDDVTYLSVDAPGRGGALVAIDGGGITMVGYASTDDRTKVDAALGAKPLAISAAQWDAWQAQAIWRAR